MEKRAGNILKQESLEDREFWLNESQRIARIGHYNVNIKTGVWTSSPMLDELLGLNDEYKKNVSSWINTVHPDDREELWEYRQSVLKEKKQFNREYRVLRPGDGNVLWLHEVGNLSFDAIGEPQSMFGTVQDITQRKIAEEALKASESRYKTFISQVAEGVYRFEMIKPMPVNLPVEEQIDFIYDNLIMAECNASFSNMYGVGDTSELTGKSMMDFHGGRNNPVNRRALRNLVESGYQIENEVTEELDASGGLHYFLNNSVCTIENGFLTRLWGTQLDITKNKQYEKQLLESQENYKRLVDTIPIGMVLYQDDKIVFANPAAAEMAGAKNPGELLNRNILEFSHPDYYRENLRRLQELAEGRAMPPIEEKLIRLDGREIYVEVAAVCTVYQGKPAVQLMVQDITKRREYEEALKESEKFMKTVIDAMPDIVCFKDGGGRWLLANHFDLQLFKLEGVDYVGKTDLQLAEYSPFFYEAFSLCEESDEQAWKAGVISRCDEIIPMPEGGTKIFDILKVPLFTDGGERKGLIVIGRDITERKLIESALKESLKEKEILLKEIHHRVKNNLQIISSLLSLQNDSISLDNFRKSINDSRTRIRTMAMIHEKLYRTSNFTNLQFDEYVSDLVSYLYHTYGSKDGRIEIKEDLKKVVLPLDMAIPMALIINELVSNVFKYAFPGEAAGILSVSMDMDSEQLLLRVKDNGTGLPEGTDLQNTATLGLVMVQNLVQQLKGTLEMISCRGLECLIRVPVRDGQVQ